MQIPKVIYTETSCARPCSLQGASGAIFGRRPALGRTPSTGSVKRFDAARPVDLMDNTAVLPTAPHHHISGQSISYLSRSVQFVSDRTARFARPPDWLGVRTVLRHPRRHPLRPGGTGRRQGQYRPATNRRRGATPRNLAATLVTIVPPSHLAGRSRPIASDAITSRQPCGCTSTLTGTLAVFYRSGR